MKLSDGIGCGWSLCAMLVIAVCTGCDPIYTSKLEVKQRLGTDKAPPQDALPFREEVMRTVASAAAETGFTRLQGDDANTETYRAFLAPVKPGDPDCTAWIGINVTGGNEATLATITFAQFLQPVEHPTVTRAREAIIRRLTDRFGGDAIKTANGGLFVLKPGRQ